MVDLDLVVFQGKGDGVTDNTQAFRDAIHRCELEGGGTIYVPAGTYLTGPIELKSNITLYLSAGSIIRFSDDFDLYQPVKTRWSGYECYGYSPLIFGENLTNVTIKGEGVIDGQGKAWWDVNRELRKNSLAYSSETTKKIAELNREFMEPINTNLVEWDSQFLRPPLLQLINCDHVTIEGVTLTNSPFWNTHLVYCNDVTVHNIAIKNPADAPNGDGLDIDSCSNVRVSNCHFETGDDCLVLKSGINEDGRRVGKPTENVVVTNCTMLHGHGGLVIGSEMSGGIKNVTISNCTFIGTDRGIRLKTNRERGGYIRNIMVDNIFMTDVFCPIAINSFYRHGVDENNPLVNSMEAVPVTEKTPIVEDIHISKIVAKNCRAAAGFIYGLPEMPIKNLTINDVRLETTTDPNEVGGEPDMVKEEIFMAGEGIYCKFVEDVTFSRVRIETRQGPGLRIDEADSVVVEHLTTKNRHDETPVIELKNTKNSFVDGRFTSLSKEEYLSADERSKQELTYFGN